jgi:hypothetical protein
VVVARGKIQTTRSSYEVHKWDIPHFCRSVLPALHREGRLTYERFCALIERYPGAFPLNYLQTPNPRDRRPPISTPDELAVRDFAARYAWAAVQTLDDRALRLLELNEIATADWTEVPPVIFSEVMRDADLIVSAAHGEAAGITRGGP